MTGSFPIFECGWDYVVLKENILPSRNLCWSVTSSWWLWLWVISAFLPQERRGDSDTYLTREKDGNMVLSEVHYSHALLLKYTHRHSHIPWGLCWTVVLLISDVFAKHNYENQSGCFHWSQWWPTIFQSIAHSFLSHSKSHFFSSLVHIAYYDYF